MPKLRLQGTDLEYTDADIITFDEGLIGLPALRRMVLARHEGIEPFMWLASLDADAPVAFLVARPADIYSEYAPALSSETCARLGLAEGEQPLALVTATIAEDWAQSTFNLRAPILVAPRTMRASQTVLTDSPYRLDEPVPTVSAA